MDTGYTAVKESLGMNNTLEPTLADVESLALAPRGTATTLLQQKYCKWMYEQFH